MEYWSVYDINRQKTSQIKLKGESFEKGEFHQVVHCSIINEKNINLLSMNARASKDKIVLVNSTLEITSIDQLNDLMKKIRKVKNVLDVYRVTS